MDYTTSFIKLEELNSVDQVKNERYSNTITRYTNCIFKHLYEEIAKVVELSPNYLSSLFKKDVGISVSEYIQQTKIEEAKKLLLFSDTPVSEICSLLYYIAQSYFIKVIRKFVEYTPKVFRERHLLRV